MLYAFTYWPYSCACVRQFLPVNTPWNLPSIIWPLTCLDGHKAWAKGPTDFCAF